MLSFVFQIYPQREDLINAKKDWDGIIIHGMTKLYGDPPLLAREVIKITDPFVKSRNRDAAMTAHFASRRSICKSTTYYFGKLVVVGFGVLKLSPFKQMQADKKKEEKKSRKSGGSPAPSSDAPAAAPVPVPASESFSLPANLVVSVIL